MNTIKIKMDVVKDNIESIMPHVRSDSLYVDASSFIDYNQNNPELLSKVLKSVQCSDINTCKFVLKQNKAIINIFANQIVEYIVTRAKAQSGYYWNTYKNKCKDFSELMKLIDQQGDKCDILRAKLQDALISDYKKINSKCKNKAFEYLMSWARTSKDKETIIKTFRGSISKSKLIKEIQELPSKNISMATILGVTNARVFKFSKADVKNHKKKVQLCKDIARQNSSIQYLRYTTKITKEDLLAMPPVSRFNFLKWYYEDHFKVAKKMSFSSVAGLRAQIRKRKKNLGRDKINMDKELTYSEIEEMLFTVAIKKNAKTTSFLNDFKKFSKFLDKNVIFINKGHWL